jgi:hypothetical protein
LIFSHEEIIFLRRVVSGTASDFYDHGQRQRLRESCCNRVLHAVEDVQDFIDLVKAKSIAPSVHATARTAARVLVPLSPAIEKLKTQGWTPDNDKAPPKPLSARKKAQLYSDFISGDAWEKRTSKRRR